MEMKSALPEEVEFHARLLQLRALAQLAGHGTSDGADRAVVGRGIDILRLVEGEVAGYPVGRTVHQADVPVIQTIPGGVLRLRRNHGVPVVIGGACVGSLGGRVQGVGIVQLHQIAAQAVQHTPLRRELQPMLEEDCGVLKIGIDGGVRIPKRRPTRRRRTRYRYRESRIENG